MEQCPKTPQVDETPKSNDDLKEFVEMHDFPNRTVLKNDCIDLSGEKISAKSVLFYQPGDGVKVENEIIYGEYMDEKGDTYWVSIADADYGAQRKSGYTQAELQKQSYKK